jgi:hypothetical protein
MKAKFIALKSLVAIAGLAVWQGCFRSGVSTEHGNEHQTRQNRLDVAQDEKVRLLNGEIIGRGLVLFAENNKGVLPKDLESLVPGYLGTNIPVGEFHLSYPGETNQGSYAIIAAEREMTNARNVVIRADGIAYLLRPVD